MQYEFDEKLETLRADLRAKETQIEVLRSGALSGMVSRQAALNTRRLEAVEQLWAGIDVLAPLKWHASVMATVKFEAALTLASKNKEFRQVFEAMASPVDIQNLSKVDVHKARPFVSEIAWALFCAYQAILGYASTQLQMLKVGLDTADILNSEHVSKLAKVAMPHYADYIDTHGTKGYFYMLEPIESELLKELQRMMRGEESDKESVEQAKKIMTEVESLQRVTSQLKTT